MQCVLKGISLTPRRARNTSMPSCQNDCNKVSICQSVGIFAKFDLADYKQILKDRKYFI